MIDRSRFSRLSVLAGSLVALIGATVLVGWMTDNIYLKAVNPDFVSMKPNTALCLLLLGVALVLRQSFSGSAKLVAVTRVMAIFVAAVGLFSLSQYLLDTDWGIDQLLFTDSPNAVHTTYLGRMAPITAVACLFLGIALSQAEKRLGARIAQVACPTAFAIGLFVLVGYAYEEEWLLGIAEYTPMAIHTAFSFLLLSLGTLCIFPDYGILRVLRSETPGGLMLRRLLPTAILLPLVLGWLRLQGEMAGLYSTRFATSMFALTMAVVLVASVIWSAVTMSRLDEERRRAANELDRFFDASLDLLCIAGTDGFFKRINQVWSKTLGYSTEELLSRPYLDFIHADDRESTIAAASELAEGRDVVAFENRYRKRDGAYVWFSWVVRAPGKGETSCFAIARDMTEKKLNEERLKQLNAELEAFSYSVSHDLRAPLRSLDGFSRALVEDYGDRLNETATDYLHRIRAGAQRMGELIDDLLQLSRLSRTEITSRPVDLTNLAQSIVTELREQEPHRNVEIIIDPGLTAQGDLHLLRAALQNLLGNAWKYTGQKATAHIRFGIRSEGGEAIYFVQDDGAGFDMAYVKKLFGAFQRLHIADEFEGNGIGLATVQRIIHRHGGRIWAEGVVDLGATFYFTLPMADTKGEEYDRKDHLAGRGQLGRRAIDAACT